MQLLTCNYPVRDGHDCVFWGYWGGLHTHNTLEQHLPLRIHDRQVICSCSTGRKGLFIGDLINVETQTVRRLH